MTEHQSNEQQPAEINWAQLLRRRFFSVRALLWPAIIVAVALLVSRYEQPNQPKPPPPAPPPPQASQFRETPSIGPLPASSGHRSTRSAP